MFHRRFWKQVNLTSGTYTRFLAILGVRLNGMHCKCDEFKADRLVALLKEVLSTGSLP